MRLELSTHRQHDPNVSQHCRIPWSHLFIRTSIHRFDKSIGEFIPSCHPKVLTSQTFVTRKSMLPFI